MNDKHLGIDEPYEKAFHKGWSNGFAYALEIQREFSILVQDNNNPKKIGEAGACLFVLLEQIYDENGGIL